MPKFNELLLPPIANNSSLVFSIKTGAFTPDAGNLYAIAAAGPISVALPQGSTGDRVGFMDALGSSVSIPTGFGAKPLTINPPSSGSIQGLAGASGAIVLGESESIFLRCISTGNWRIEYGLPQLSMAPGQFAYSGRVSLTADTTVYISPTGSPGNTGMSPGSPWDVATLITRLGKIDFASYQFTVQALPGTYSVSSPILLGRWYGMKPPIFQGDLSDPSKVVFAATVNNIAIFGVTDNWRVRGMTMRGLSGGTNVALIAVSARLTVRALIFDTLHRSIDTRDNASFAFEEGPTSERTLSFMGSNYVGLMCLESSAMTLVLGSVTCLGNTSFSGSWLFASRSSNIYIDSIQYSGSASGNLFDVTRQSVISVLGSSGSPPGNGSGNQATGGTFYNY